jgi:K(+)-stimulated pyrophosphate-energized sodium pump
MLPGAIAMIVPIVIGFIFGPEVLGGTLAGVTVSGVLMGMFQSNAGGAWDNAKKSFEKGVEIDGQIYYKKSEPHKASVTGDTVGDPFKDTSGPSMNILIKLMSIVSLVIAPAIAQKDIQTASIQTNPAHSTSYTECHGGKGKCAMFKTGECSEHTSKAVEASVKPEKNNTDCQSSGIEENTSSDSKGVFKNAEL